MDLIIKFLLLTAAVSGTIIFFLHRTLITSTEGAVKRLNEEIEKANTKQAELAKKLKEADEDLKRKQAEAKQLANKMRSDAEAETVEAREKIVNQARAEGEEIIAKAQSATEKMKEDLLKSIDEKGVDLGMVMLNDVLSEKAKGVLDQVFIEEFLEGLKETDMSRLAADITKAEVVTLSALDDSTKSKLSEIIKGKVNRELSLENSTDENLGGGMILKFGSMALDGSVKNRIREVAVEKKAEIDER